MMNCVIDNGYEYIGYSYDVLDYIRNKYIKALKNLSIEDYNYIQGLTDCDLDIMCKLNEMNELVRVVYTDESYEIYTLHPIKCNYYGETE